MMRLILGSVLVVAAASTSVGLAASAPTSAAEIRPLLVGAEVPAVTLKTPGGKDTELRKLVAQQPSILIFYRGGW